MRIVSHGILNRGEPGTNRAVSTFPSLTPLADGSLLALYRVGSTKDCDDERLELRRSTDAGHTWSEPARPFSTTLGGAIGSLKVGYMTEIEAGRLLLAAMWVDREPYPGQPLFNEETEGALPIKLVLSDSFDKGNSWSPWRPLPSAPELGPPSLTNPILKLPSGRLALSIETNKHYEDSGPWRQRVVYLYSDDQGDSWSEPLTVSQDPTGRIFNWDQRAGLDERGRLATFSWTYDRQTNTYLNVHRRISVDEGASWTEAEDLGFADQASHPAILSDGRVVMAWVDRFGSRSIRARVADAVDQRFEADTEVEIYRLADAAPTGPGRQTGDLLAQMGLWNFGLPFAAALPDDDALVVYYAGDAQNMWVRWVRLAP